MLLESWPGGTSISRISSRCLDELSMKKKAVQWVLGILVVLFALTAALLCPPLFSKPYVPYDVVAELEATAPPMEEGSWPLVVEAIDRLPELPWPDMLDDHSSEADRQEFERWLLDNQDLIELLREAGSRAHSGQPYRPVAYEQSRLDYYERTGDLEQAAATRARMASLSEVVSPWEIRVSRLIDLHPLANLLALSARRASAEGRRMDSLLDLEAAFGLGRQLSKKRSGVIDHMIGRALERTAGEEFRRLLPEHAADWTPEELERLAHSPFCTAKQASLAEVVDGEYKISLSMVDFLFAEGFSDWEQLIRLDGSSSSGLEDLARYLGHYLVEGREETLERLELKHAHLLKLEHVARHERGRFEDLPESIMPRGPLADFRSPLVGHLMPPNIYRSLTNVLEDARLEVEVHRLALALIEWRQAEGQYPESLIELVPRYLEFLPIDPCDGRPIRYRKVDGEVRVYSVSHSHGSDGGNAEDEGGVSPDDRLFLKFQAVED